MYDVHTKQTFLLCSHNISSTLCSNIHQFLTLYLKIKSIHVKNYRSIKDEILECDVFTGLIGANNSGKSSFLKAFDIFQTKNIKLPKTDFNDLDTDIEIEIYFYELPPEIIENFSIYIVDDTLRINRTINYNSKTDDSTSLYYAYKHTNDQFKSFRDGNTADIRRDEYIKLQKKFSELENCRNDPKRFKQLDQYEYNHKDTLPIVKQKITNLSFFNHVEFFYISATQDPKSEDSDQKNNILQKLMKTIKEQLESDDTFKNFNKYVNKEYKKIVTDYEKSHLMKISSEVTSELKNFYPSASVNMKWNVDNADVSLPYASPFFNEDENYDTPMDNVGSGLQRAFFISLLKTWTNKFSTSSKSIILLIEEPELFQHPVVQRYISKSLKKLSESGIQIIFSTHSAYFATVSNIDNLRFLHKETEMDSKPQITKLIRITIADIESELKDICDGNVFDVRKSLLSAENPIVNEGLFSKNVILVEGETDKLLLNTVAAENKFDFDENQITIIPTHGKRSILILGIFLRMRKSLRYMIWDSDKNKAKITDDNKRLSDAEKQSNINFIIKMNKQLQIFNGITSNYDDFPDTVSDNYCCFESNIEVTLSHEKYEKSGNDNLSFDDFNDKFPKLRQHNTVELITEHLDKTKGNTVLNEILRNLKKSCAI